MTIASRLASPLIYAAVGVGIAMFLYSGLRGERGLGVLADARAEAVRLEQERERLAAERRAAENRARRLRTDYLDLDLLDERARAVLGYVRADEVVIRPVAR